MTTNHPAGKAVVIGGGTMGSGVAMVFAARAVPNGYTLLLSSIATHALAPNLYKNPGYDPVKDFSPITLLAVAPTVLVMNNSMPFKNVQDFVVAAKAAPGKYTYASGGAGTPPHMAGVIFASMNGINLLHVPYKGGLRRSSTPFPGRPI